MTKDNMKLNPDKTYFLHLRPTFFKDGIEQISPTGGMTIAYKQRADGTLLVGLARCFQEPPQHSKHGFEQAPHTKHFKKSDNYNKKIARQISSGRMQYFTKDAFATSKETNTFFKQAFKDYMSLPNKELWKTTLEKIFK